MGTDFTNVTLTDHVNIKSEEHGIRVVRIVVVHVTIVGVAEVVRVFRIRRTKPKPTHPATSAENDQYYLLQRRISITIRFHNSYDILTTIIN